jgi:hypothetical protein
MCGTCPCASSDHGVSSQASRIDQTQCVVHYATTNDILITWRSARRAYYNPVDRELYAGTSRYTIWLNKNNVPYRIVMAVRSYSSREASQLGSDLILEGDIIRCQAAQSELQPVSNRRQLGSLRVGRIDRGFRSGGNGRINRNGCFGIGEHAGIRVAKVRSSRTCVSVKDRTYRYCLNSHAHANSIPTLSRSFFLGPVSSGCRRNTSLAIHQA